MNAIAEIRACGTGMKNKVNVTILNASKTIFKVMRAYPRYIVARWWMRLLLNSSLAFIPPLPL